MKFWLRQADRPADIKDRAGESEAGSSTLCDALTDPIVAIALSNGLCVYRNEAFTRYGHTRAESLGQRFIDLGLWTLGVPTLDQFLEKLARLGSIRNESVDLRLSGRVVPHTISATFVDFGGEKCALLSFHDRAPVPRVSDDTVAASRSKSDFLTDLSHEIRTPLNTILAMADLLSEVQLPDEGRRFVDAMIASGHTLLDLVNSVLDLDKIETGRLELESVVFEIEGLIDYVVGTVAASAHRKGIEIVGRVTSGVPRQVVGDPLRLRQILLNLVCNAVESTDSGEVLLTVERTEETREAWSLRFTVTDTGTGIPQKKVDEINRSFSESAETVRSGLGTNGLGLSIVKGLLELMDGHIHVQSEIGKGSTFIVLIGLEAPEGCEVVDQYADVDFEGLRVLVIDDNGAKRQKIKAILSDWGAEVAEANSGENALSDWRDAKTRSNPYRLALVDCALVDMDGFELAKSMRELSDADQRIIMMLTLDELNSKVARARAEGITDYVVKPVTRSELHSGLSNALGLRPPSAAGKIAALKEERRTVTKRLHILVVEDSHYNCMVVRAFLKNKPYELDFAEDGAIAVEKFTTRKYDLILMDIRMPVMNGYEATRKIRAWELEQNRTPIPIVALTASALEQDIQESMLAGCTAHVSKPIKKMLLLETIRDMTESDSYNPSLEGGRLPEPNALAGAPAVEH
jgi:signal transduction histidine kinase/CheY-like chemotaxis protein